MDEQPLNLKNVAREEQKEKLSPVDKNFYEKARTLIHELEIDLARADPGSTKYGILEHDINTAKKNYNSILETRMAKINFEASVRKSLKRQDDREPENMTPEEMELYTALYTTMRDWRSERMNGPARVKAKTPAVAPQSQPQPQSPPEPARKPEVKRDIRDYVVVRVLSNIPTFAGMDGRNYTLAKEDVATVPAVNAKALIARGAAVQLPAGGNIARS